MLQQSEVIKNTGSEPGYPNPSFGILTVQIPERESKNARLQIVDVTGRTMLEQELRPDAIHVSINSLSEGTYFVKIFSDGRLIVEKITLIH